MTEQEKREKVIRDLDEQITWIRDNDFHKFPGWGHAVLAMTDALALLKAQEPVMMAGAELTDAELIDAIRKAPITLKPAVDAVPVVRCKDCMYFRPWRHDRGEDSRCEFWNTEMGAEDYCSQAVYLNNGSGDDA